MTHADRRDRDRWIASGMPDALVTIMFRDGTLPPPHAARWYDSSLTTGEITAFRRAGRQAPDVAFVESLEERGLPTDVSFVERWAGFDATTILSAIDRGFTSGEQFSPWAETDADAVEVESLSVPFDFDRAEALARLRDGVPPQEIVFALEAGLKVRKARSWMRRGLSSTTAAEWSGAGFSAKETERWAEVVADPSVAASLRSLGLDPEAAHERRPETGWTAHEVRRFVALDAGAADPTEADAWASTSIPDRKLAAWVRSGVRAADAERWRAEGFEPRQAARWHDRGFCPEDARAWRDADVAPGIAARRRDAGVRPPAG